MKKKIFSLILCCVLTNFCFAFPSFYINSGYRIVADSKLQERDFDGYSFFMKDYKNPYKKDLNVQIFNKVMANLEKSRPNKTLEALLKKKKGQAVIYKDGDIYFGVYDKTLKKFRFYGFWLKEGENDYSNYCKNIDLYKSSEEGIEWCNWAIKNCTNPLITKTRIVMEPYTDYIYTIGTSGPGITRTEAMPITSYREKKEEYTVANPNYDPAKVERANKNLPIYKKNLQTAKDNLSHFPFELYHLDGEDFPHEN